MSFAGFNSGKFVKGRLQAALYTMRKRNRLRRQEDSEPVTTAPEQFGSADWSITDLATGANARISILALPADGGSPITDIEYSVEADPWISVGGSTVGDYDIGGLQTGVVVGVRIRAVNVNGAGPASGSKPVTPT